MFLQAARYSSTSVLIPKSITSKPAPSSIMATRFCRCRGCRPLPCRPLLCDRLGSSLSEKRPQDFIPAFMAFAARALRGRTDSISKSIPTMRIPSTRASFSTLSAAHPRMQYFGTFDYLSASRLRSSCICAADLYRQGSTNPDHRRRQAHRSSSPPSP